MVKEVFTAKEVKDLSQMTGRPEKMIQEEIQTSTVAKVLYENLLKDKSH